MVTKNDNSKKKEILSLIDSLDERIGSSDYSKNAEELVKSGEEVIPFLLDNLRKSSWIPWILGKIGNKRAFEPLCKLLFEDGAFERDKNNPFPGHRAVCAAEALGVLGDEAALPKLEQIARDTMDGTLLNAVTEAIAQIRKVGVYSPQQEEPTIANTPRLEQLKIANEQSTSGEMLDRLASSNDIEVIIAIAQNPSALPDTLRNLNKRFCVEGKRLYWQFANNPNCPRDILEEIVEKCGNPYTVELARNHPNFDG